MVSFFSVFWCSRRGLAPDHPQPFRSSAPNRYRERILFLGQQIDDELANQIIAIMLYLDSESKDAIRMSCIGFCSHPRLHEDVSNSGSADDDLQHAEDQSWH